MLQLSGLENLRRCCACIFTGNRFYYSLIMDKACDKADAYSVRGCVEMSSEITLKLNPERISEMPMLIWRLSY